MTAEYCRKHKVSVSISPTYVYQKLHSNFMISSDLINKVKKVERWRLGNERSEDALSWNVFLSLAKLGLLSKAFQDFPSGKIELYLWGNRIGRHLPVVWDKLTRVRKRLESGARFPTEPDIIIRIPGQLLMLIEAKFGSCNSTLLGKEDRYEGVDEFLSRYPANASVPDPLNREWIEGQKPSQVYEQLCRNVIYATWLREKGERLIVANLVCKNMETEIEQRFRNHLNANCPLEFRRITWESFYPVLLSSGENAGPIISYMENKTMNLKKAFQL